MNGAIQAGGRRSVSGQRFSSCRAQIWVLRENFHGVREIIGLEKIVIVAKDEELAAGLGDAASAGNGQAQFFLANQMALGMPREQIMRHRLGKRRLSIRRSSHSANGSVWARSAARLRCRCSGRGSWVQRMTESRMLPKASARGARE